MRPAAVEVVGVAGLEDVDLAVHGELERPAEDDARLLRFVPIGLRARVRPRTVALDEELKRAAPAAGGDVPERNPLLAGDLDQLPAAVDDLLRGRRRLAEEVGQRHAEDVEDRLQGRDGDIVPAPLQAGEEAHRDPGAPGNLAEGKLAALAERAEPGGDV